MPTLPLDHPEPFAATLGVMLYPGTDEGDRQKAAAFTAQYLAEPIRQRYAQGGVIEHHDLLQIYTASGHRVDDLEKRWWGGTATGELLKVLFILAHNNPEFASWDNAVEIAQTVAARHRVSGSRSSLWKQRSMFLAVAHLWAAWRIREGQFHADPAVHYDTYTDFQFFLAESEILRRWGQSWRPPRKKATPPLPDEVWCVPDNWSPPARQAGWPNSGMIPDLVLHEDLLEALRPAGRPRKRT